MGRYSYSYRKVTVSFSVEVTVIGRRVGIVNIEK